MNERRDDLDEQRILEQALNDWKAAQNFFEQVTDPELIEYAIYDMEAARRKYFYLVKKARQAN